jgi:hypothetical protein
VPFAPQNRYVFVFVYRIDEAVFPVNSPTEQGAVCFEPFRVPLAAARDYVVQKFAYFFCDLPAAFLP